jgi:uncharacterized protein
MIFEVHAEKNAEDKRIFFYDNEVNRLTDEHGKEYRYDPLPENNFKSLKTFSKNAPLRKDRLVTTLKIQLGLSCNYACDYCSQKFVERAPETSKKDIDAFMEMLNNLDFSEEKGLNIEFWGGEPLVYWKTIQPLVDAIQDKFSGWHKDPNFSMITNGSILTKEICDWLVLKGFNIGLSHDGPGQHVRGPDPFEDPKQKKIIIDLYKVMAKHNRMSFNSMLNARNPSRKAIYDYFVELTGDKNVSLGEGSLVDAYDVDGLENALTTYAQHFDFRKQAFADVISTGGQIGFKGQILKIDRFIQDVLSGYNSDFLGQKCGMDSPDVISVDLRGNVITCQNVSAVGTAPNGESHCGGHISDMSSVEIKTATSWRDRPNCASCPVLHVCRGSCMFLEDDLWNVSCDNAYSDNVALFALGIEKITGYIPYLIKNDSLPLDRQDIFGTVFEHKEKEVKKAFPVRVVSTLAGQIDGVEVYAKAEV